MDKEWDATQKKLEGMNFFQRIKATETMTRDEQLQMIAESPEAYEELKSFTEKIKQFEGPQLIESKDGIWTFTKYWNGTDIVRLCVLGLIIKYAPSLQDTKLYRRLTPKSRVSMKYIHRSDYKEDLSALCSIENGFAEALYPDTKKILQLAPEEVVKTMRISRNLEPAMLARWFAVTHESLLYESDADV